MGIPLQEKVRKDMLHILFLILKITGIVLLVILGLILFVLAVVLFVPVRYRVSAEKDRKMHAQIRLSWLMGMIQMKAEYNGEQADTGLFVFGRPLFNKKPEKRKSDKRRGKKESEQPDEEPSASAISQLPELTEHTCYLKPDGHQPEPRQDSGLSDRIEKLKATAGRWLDFWNLEVTQAAKKHIWKEMRYLFRHSLPRRAEGQIAIGMGDPATTGQVLGILYVISAFTGNCLEINGEFEKTILKGHFQIKGHVRICHIAKAALSLLADKNIRQAVRLVRQITAFDSTNNCI